MVKTFEAFSSPEKTNWDTAGIAILLEEASGKSILLVHPTGASWQKPTMGIPKGKIETGESPVEAAIRETFEETGIQVTLDMLEKSVETAEVWKGTKFMYNVHYLVCRIKDPAEIGLVGKRVPKQQLQEAEVDWAGFVSIGDAYSKMIASQRIILDRLA